MCVIECQKLAGGDVMGASKFCITTDEDLRIETSCIPLKSVLRAKLINFSLQTTVPQHHDEPHFREVHSAFLISLQLDGTN